MHWRSMKEVRALGHVDELEALVKKKEVDKKKRVASRINNTKV